MIVRDEAEWLQGCVASVAEGVDEIIVVDTGSVDGTPKVAERLGARVVHHPWADDFSEARNVALDHATGDFVLVLDADERLTGAAAREVRRACARGVADALLLPLHNADRKDASLQDVISGAARKGGVTYLPRVFRRDPDLRWVGAIHESPGPWLAAAGRRIRRLDGAPIVHFGYAPELVELRRKGQRNRRLLERRCQDEPHCPDPRAYLAKELLDDGQPEAALLVALQGWDRARAIPVEQRRRPVILHLVATTLELLANWPPEDAVYFASEALEWGLDHPTVLHLCGVAFERAGATMSGNWLARAYALYGQGRAWQQTPLLPVPPLLQDVVLPTRQAILLCKMGLSTKALALLEQVPCRDAPASLQLARAEAMLGCGRLGEALGLLTALVQSPSGVSDAWWLAAEVLWRLGQPEEAHHCLARARALGPATESHREVRARRQFAQRLAAPARRSVEPRCADRPLKDPHPGDPEAAV